MDSDELEFLDEDEPGASRTGAACWRVLIVDDDNDVHDATRLVLANAQVMGRELELLHARSAAEAREILQREQDIAVILLDVVMEEENAGLKLVDHIRRDLHLEEVRIILRTGQPGHAPELEAIRDYDINDYKTKTELTRHKLYTTLTTALRSFEQIRTINASRRGLELIVNACQRITAEHGLQAFAAGVITQIAALLGIPPEGLICARCLGEEGEEGEGEYQIVAAAGRYTELVYRSLDAIGNEPVRELLSEALRKRESLLLPTGSVLFFAGSSGKDMAAYVAAGTAVSGADHKLLELFCRNVGRCLDNIDLIERLTRRMQMEEWLHLANRNGLCEALQATRAQVPAPALTLLHVELAAGASTAELPAALRELARRLRERMRGQGVAASLAADRFAVLAPPDAPTVDELVALLSKPVELAGALVQPSVHSLRMSSPSTDEDIPAWLAVAELRLVDQASA